MKKLVTILAVLGMILVASASVQASVTPQLDPDDLIQLYPGSAGTSDAVGQNKATQPNDDGLWPAGLVEVQGYGSEGVLTLTAIPEAASIAIWSLLGLSWLGLSVWRRRRRMAGGGGRSARPSWSKETRQALHRIIDRG